MCGCCLSRLSRSTHSGYSAYSDVIKYLSENGRLKNRILTLIWLTFQSNTPRTHFLRSIRIDRRENWKRNPQISVSYYPCSYKVSWFLFGFKREDLRLVFQKKTIDLPLNRKNFKGIFSLFIFKRYTKFIKCLPFFMIFYKSRSFRSNEILIRKFL